MATDRKFGLLRSLVQYQYYVYVALSVSLFGTGNGTTVPIVSYYGTVVHTGSTSRVRTVYCTCTGIVTLPVERESGNVPTVVILRSKRSTRL